MEGLAAPAVIAQPGLLIPFALVQLTVVLLLARSIDLFERKPLGLVALMALAGATVAPIVALAVRAPVDAVTGAQSDQQRVVVAALVEEPAKALCVLALYVACLVLAGRLGELEFAGVNDGMVYGAAAGLGFAFTENLFYLVGQGDLSAGLSVFSDRTDFFGIRILSHAVYTTCFGAGLGLAARQRRRSLQVALPLLGLAVGTGMHAAHNVLAQRGAGRAVALLDYAFLVLALGAMALWLARERRTVVRVLAEERALGLPVTDADVALAASYPVALRRQWAAFRTGNGPELQRVRTLRAALVQLALSAGRAGARAQEEAAGHRVEVGRLLAPPPVGVSVPPAALAAFEAASARAAVERVDRAPLQRPGARARSTADRPAPLARRVR